MPELRESAATSHAVPTWVQPKSPPAQHDQRHNSHQSGQRYGEPALCPDYDTLRCMQDADFRPVGVLQMRHLNAYGSTIARPSNPNRPQFCVHGLFADTRP